jgi:hypothetical protein
MVENTNNNSRLVTWNIKKKYVLKRPVLSTYETTLTEKEIFTKYCDAQKMSYFRICAFPQELFLGIETDTGNLKEYNTINTVNVPGTPDAACTKLGNGVTCQITKRSSFKLDETAANF